MTNARERRLGCLVTMKNVKSSFKMSIGELQFKSDSKRFGTEGRKSFEQGSLKDFVLETSCDAEEMTLDLNAFIEGMKQVVKDSVVEPAKIQEAKKEDAIIKAYQPMDMPQQPAPEKEIPLKGFIKNLSDEELESMIRQNSYREVAKWIRRVLYRNKASKAAKQIDLDALELEVEMSSIGRLIEILRAASLGNDITGSLPID